MLCELGLTKVAEILLERSVQFDIKLYCKDKKGNTPFDLAYYNRHSDKAYSDIVKLFKDASVKGEIPNSYHERSIVKEFNMQN